MRLRFLTLAICLGAWIAAGCSKPMAPDVHFTALESGEKKKLSDYRGKVVLIDMWATWCGPCRQTMPIVERMYNQYGEKGLEVIAITGETAPAVRAFLKDNRMNQPVYLDTDNSVSESFKSTAIPDCVVVGKDGSVLYRGHPGDEATLERAIQSGLQ